MRERVDARHWQVSVHRYVRLLYRAGELIAPRETARRLVKVAVVVVVVVLVVVVAVVVIVVVVVVVAVVVVVVVVLVVCSNMW